MIKVRTKTTGNLFAGIDKLEMDVQGVISMAGVAAMARVIYKEALAYAEPHKKSGLLQSAIYRRYNKEKSTGVTRIYDVTWSEKFAKHGHLLEYGTSRAPAYPFMTPAYQHVGEALKEGKKRMAEALAKRNAGATE